MKRKRLLATTMNVHGDDEMMMATKMNVNGVNEK